MKALLQGAARRLRGALASNSAWGAPLARALLVAVALAVLAFVGRSSGADPSPSVPAAADLPPAALPSLTTDAGVPPDAASVTPSGRASPESPVVLNSASIDDLRRLPGVGPKRAEAILNLRNRLGRFRRIEDLLRVRGIGRATLKRLRPLVRLDS
jgi:competence protein ComEA